MLQGSIKGDPGMDGTGITPQGEWDSATDYVLNDAVSNEGSLWRATQVSTNETPPSMPTTSNDYWNILVAIGSTGANGTNGVDGAAGNDLSIEYSFNGSTSWHTTYQTGDLYIRFSTDGEVTWSDGIQFITDGVAEPPPDSDYYARKTGGWYSLEEAGKVSGTSSQLTISNGAVTRDKMNHSIKGEGGVSDDLDTINGGVNGALLLIYPEIAAQKITIKHGAGNIVTSNGADYLIPDDGIALLWYDDSKWRMIGSSSSIGELTESQAIEIALIYS